MFKKAATASFLVLFIFLHAWLAAAAEQRLLEDIKFEAPSDTEERITFKLNRSFIPKIFAIKGEKPRVVFDFPDTGTARLLNNNINTNGKFIKRIRVGIHNEPSPKTRVVFDLLPDQDINFKQDFNKAENALIITVYHAGAEPDSKPEKEKEVKEVQPAKPVQPEEKSLVPALVPALVPEPVIPTAQPQTGEEVQTPTAEAPALIQPAPQLIAPAQPESEAEPPLVQPQPEAEQAQVQPPVPAAEIAPSDLSPAQTVLSSVTFDDSTNRGEMVLFKLNEFHSPIVFGLEEGQPRVVCDFKNTTAADDVPNVIKAGGKYVHTIRIGREQAPKKVRVVLDLAPSNSYDLQQVFFKDDNLFVIIINTLHNTPTTEELEKPLQ